MEVKEARTDGQNYHLHVFQSDKDEILSIPKLEAIMRGSDVTGEIEITGWKGIHLVILTSNNPSVEKFRSLCKEIKKADPLLLEEAIRKYNNRPT